MLIRMPIPIRLPYSVDTDTDTDTSTLIVMPILVLRPFFRRKTVIITIREILAIRQQYND